MTTMKTGLTMRDSQHKFHMIPALVTLALLLLLPFHAQAQAAQPPQLSVAPATLQIPAGKTAEIAVQIDGVQDLYGADITLKFDPNAVEVVAEDPAKPQTPLAIGTFLDPGFVVLNNANNISGTVRFAMTQMNPSKPKSGNGTLIVLLLRGKSEGATSVLTLTNVTMARMTGVVFTGTLVSGNVQVVDASKVVANATFPKQGAGTPMPAAAELATVISPKATPPPSSTGASVPGSGGAGAANLDIPPAVIGAVGGAAGVGVILLGFTAVQNRRRKTEDNRKP